MTAQIFWLAVFAVMYAAFCVARARQAAAASTTADDYFLAGRAVPGWLLVPAAAAAAFAGLGLLHHPALIYAHGLPYAALSLGAVAVPLAGAVLVKRQWILARRFGFVTPGEMLAAYFQSRIVRLLTVAVALSFTVPLLAAQLRMSGLLVQLLSDGRLPIETGIWLAGAILIAYVGGGGLRAVLTVGALQAALFALVLIVLAAITLVQVGGFGPFAQGLGALADATGDPAAGGFSRYLAVPGVIALVGDARAAAGGPWTGSMGLTALLAVVGLQTAPAFSMLVFASRDAAAFAAQQTWGSALLTGALLVGAAGVVGMSGHLLYGQPQPPGAALALVPRLIATLGEAAPWLVGFFGVGALAASQATGALAVSTTSAMLARDLPRRGDAATASDARQIVYARLAVAVVVLAALAAASLASGFLLPLISFALAVGAQMAPALVAVCYAPWFTPAGIVVGLIAGLATVVVTDLGGAAWLGIELWGRWPLTLHSAFWGLAANFGLALAVSSLTQSADGRDHRLRFHSVLHAHAALPEAQRRRVPIAWMLVLVWLFFAAGPGTVIGNTLFGPPDDPARWTFAMPSLWAWQILWWGLGVWLIRFLAYGMALSTPPRGEIEPPADTESHRAGPRAP